MGVDDTKQLINDWTTSKEKEEKKLDDDLKNDDNSKDSAKQIVPGPRADLNIVHSVNVVDLMKRSRVEYAKEVQTDSVEIGQHSNIITEQTDNDELNEILATFIENDINPWPDKKEQVLKRINVQKQENKENGGMEEKKRNGGKERK